MTETVHDHYVIRDPVSIGFLGDHALHLNVVHTNLQVGQCACVPLNGRESVVAQPIPNKAVGADGGICFACGSMTVRTGSCTTCTSCGTSSGCG